MAEFCCFCTKEIPAGACQQSQKIGGVFYPLHVGCADVWANQEIPVCTITYDDGGYTTDLDGAIEHLKNMEPDGDEISISTSKMPRIKFLTLPEM